jgi:hypothetical protein
LGTDHLPKAHLFFAELSSIFSPDIFSKKKKELLLPSRSSQCNSLVFPVTGYVAFFNKWINSDIVSTSFRIRPLCIINSK